jgi:2-amino-4-hydroxy-6-hydroxymethyldihydropteridine diphosphokinase
MILIGLGSNLGEREEMLAQARIALEAFDMVVVAASAIYETPALMPEGAPAEWNIPFLNQVVAVNTHHGPEDILTCLKHIELELGRAPRARWAPREIDLDLLAYHDSIVMTDYLTVPHPQMDERRFVLAPLCEIAPEWRHPVLDKTARELLAELPA